jgi:hypothetical protein
MDLPALGRRWDALLFIIPYISLLTHKIGKRFKEFVM